MSSSAVALQGSAASARMRAIVLASVVGTTIEWYDFLIYGTASALVFNKQFFPSFDPFVGTLAAFATYAVGFLARPLGGAIFGHYGDRVGRKAMLMLTMLVMGAGTFLIGCLPGYATLGVWAPVMLVVLRLLQGIGLGGEWGGAVLMVIENAPEGKRGYYGSLVQVGFALGVAGSTGTFLVMSQIMSDGDFLSWGWRLPFLFSAALVAIGMFIRLRLAETPVFEQMKRTGVARMPLLDVILGQPKTFLIAVGMKVSEVAWVYILTVFSIVYITTKLHLSRNLVLDGIVLAALAEIVTLPLFGMLSDRFGRKPLYLGGAALSAVLAFPMFWLFDTGNATVIVLTLVVVMSLTHGLMFGPQAAFLPELFGTRTRYSGASLGCQVSAAISGGFAPLIAASLLGWAGASWPISLYLIGLAAIVLVSVAASRETMDLDITRG